MSLRADNRGRLASWRYLNDVAKYMNGAGIPVTTKAYKPMDDAERGDIRGLSSWCINVDRSYKRDPSGALDQLERDAKDDGKKFRASIEFRSGRTAAEQYVSMPLAVFCDVLKALDSAA